VVAVLAIAAYVVVRDLVRGYWTTRGARVEHYTVHSRFVHRDRHEIRVVPAKIHAQLHVWPGGHDSGYWHSHMRQYLAFYARHCA
jgi:enterochelin esterase-like enzyme